MRLLQLVLQLAQVGYVIYRVIRFIPSLAPPLWWSIPANVVTP
ncbi:hypothetical protein [Escherichia coli]|nr:hypothetical protein [Escherichia coli]